MTENYLTVLSESRIFREFETKRIEQLLYNRVFQVKSYPKGALIAQSGDKCNHAIVILEGLVAGEMMDVSGKVLKIEEMLPSKMIAPAFLYGNRRTYPVNVNAIENSVLWMMRRDEFSRLLQSDVQLLDNFLNSISNRAQFLSEKIRFLSFPSLRAKLAFYILQYAGNNETVKLPSTHQHMAELFGVARPSLSREIRNMNEEGLIRSDRDILKILDLEGMRKLIR